METRAEIVAIRLNGLELSTITAMAERERLPTAAFIRRHLLFEADCREFVGKDGYVPVAE